MDLTPYSSAIQAHAWLLLAALLVNLLVATAKQGWLSTWIASKLTPTTTPWYALLVSVLTVASGDIVAKMPWQKAASDAVIVAFTAIASHQLLVESIRKGVEFIRPTKAVAFYRTFAVRKPPTPVIVVPPSSKDVPS